MPDAITREDLKEFADEIRHEVRQVRKLLTGESEPERGIIVRLDRVEQSQKKSSRLVWAAMTSAAVALGSWVVTTVTGQKP